jgi:hypothetical protein
MAHARNAARECHLRNRAIGKETPAHLVHRFLELGKQVGPRSYVTGRRLLRFQRKARRHVFLFGEAGVRVIPFGKT